MVKTVRSHYFREDYYVPEGKEVVKDSSCPIDWTLLVSNGSMHHTCLACGAEYPRGAGKEGSKRYALEHVEKMQDLMSSHHIIINDIPKVYRAIKAAKAQGLICRLD